MRYSVGFAVANQYIDARFEKDGRYFAFYDGNTGEFIKRSKAKGLDVATIMGLKALKSFRRELFSCLLLFKSPNVNLTYQLSSKREILIKYKRRPLMIQDLSFQKWHAETNDSLDFKKTYVDMVDDLVAGLMLSQIVSWYLPNQDGPPRVEKNGMILYVKEHQQWYASCRITKSRARRALTILKKKEVVITEVHLFEQKATTYIRINWEGFMRAFNSATKPSGQKPLLGSTEKSIPGNTEKSIPESAQNSIPENVQKPLPESAQRELPESAQKPLPESTQKALAGSSKKALAGSTQKALTERTQKALAGSNEKILAGSSKKALGRSSQKQ